MPFSSLSLTHTFIYICHHGLVLPVGELNTNGIVQHMLLCIRLLLQHGVCEIQPCYLLHVLVYQYFAPFYFVYYSRLINH